MMLTNKSNLPLSLQLWLASDFYDKSENPKYISATTLLRPLKQIVLSRRVEDSALTDLMELVPSRIGSAIHDAIEKAWEQTNKSNALNRLRINPQILTDLNVAYEVRNTKEIAGWTIGGKFDFLCDGTLEDFKSTKVYSYQSKSNIPDYTKQASIYMWLNQEAVTNKDWFQINYILTDWLRSNVVKDAAYPRQPIICERYPLMSLSEVENFIRNKLALIDKYMDSPEEDIPECSDDELWRKPSVYKYYKNPQKMERSTKNFDTMHDAQLHLATEGVGLVKEVKGQIVRCNYCPAFDVCKQKNSYIAEGLVVPFD
jgi:hypothetical protein